MTPEEQEKATASCRQFRLQVSGSAPLPSPLKEKWRIISGGQVLLERYGMTETGMIISCGMKEHERVDGHVGLPMPGVSVRLWDEESKKDVTEELETAGEVQIKGDLVFREYWRLPDKTKEVRLCSLLPCIFSISPLELPCLTDANDTFYHPSNRSLPKTAGSNQVISASGPRRQVSTVFKAAQVLISSNQAVKRYQL